MTSSQKALDFITNAINSGKTVYVSTRLKSVMVKPATFKKWQNSDYKLFKMDVEGNLRMAAGKAYNVIATPNNCLVQITAQ